MAWSWETFLSGSAAGAVIAAGWQYLIGQHREDLQRSSAKQVIQAVMDYAEEYAASYLKREAVGSPGARVPTGLYSHSLEILLGLRVLKRDTSNALLAYFGLIETFNRSLDAIATLRTDEETHQWAIEEVRRAKLKAIAMLPAWRLRQLVQTQTVDGKSSVEMRLKLEGYGSEGTPHDKAMRVLQML